MLFPEIFYISMMPEACCCAAYSSPSIHKLQISWTAHGDKLCTRCFTELDFHLSYGLFKILMTLRRCATA